MNAFQILKSLKFAALISVIGSIAFCQSNDLFYPIRSDWDHSADMVNISSYLFNDINGNGTYDLGDKAMANIAVSLKYAGLPVAAARTNLNGFANFQASTTIEDSPLNSPGIYEFGTLVPPGWRVTTDNQTQQRELIVINGSPAGLGLARMVSPVGLTRNKFIRGTYHGDTDGHLELRQNGQTIASADLAPNEQFIWRAKRGEYTLLTNGQSRQIVVGDNPVDVGLVGLADVAEFTGRTIDFETGAPTGLNKAPNGYGGLNWFNLNIMRADMGNDSIGYINGATSGNYILYTSSGHPSKIYADTPFAFLSVNLTVAWPDSEGEEAVFAYYNGDTLLLTDSIGLSAYSPINYQPMIAGITRVEIRTKHYWQMVIDDLVIWGSP